MHVAFVRQPNGEIQTVFDFSGLNGFVFTKPFHIKLKNEVDVMIFFLKGFFQTITQSKRRVLYIIYKQKILQIRNFKTFTDFRLDYLLTKVYKSFKLDCGNPFVLVSLYILTTIWYTKTLKNKF